MKKITILIAVLALSSCSNDDSVIIYNECQTKEISLNLETSLKVEKNPIFSGKSETPSCEFPEKYNHEIPSEFNVYFIPKNGGSTIEFNGIKEGKQTFEIPKTNYRVVVTNSKKQFRGELPIYSELLYLFGESEIDFSNTDNGEVLVTNDYASIMVVDNTAITSAPKLDGQTMADIGNYYNLYTRKKGSSYLGINNDSKQVTEKFEPNQVYRYMICPEGTFTIIVDEDILEETNDVKL